MARFVLDGEDLEVRAYLASQVGPSRVVFGATRITVANLGVPVLAAENRSDTAVLFVGVQFSGPVGFARTTFGSSSPSEGNDLTLSLAPNGTPVPFVLLPGDELWLLQTDNALPVARYVVSELAF